MNQTNLELFNETLDNSKRIFLRRTGGFVMSATAVAMLAGVSTHALAGKKGSKSQDILILNTAISAEHEAIAAYQLGAKSGLLEKPVLKVAVAFQGHHKEHVDALANAIKSLGGVADDAKASYQFPVEKLKNQGDVLSFAAGLERGAVSAYANAIPAFDNRDLSLAAASILADEAMHWAVLRNALGLDPVPGAFFS